MNRLQRSKQTDRSVSPRFRCPHSGAFRCTWTGLVFVVTREAGLVYRTVQWDEPLLRSAGRTPAGPLFSIDSPENAVCQLHLPHCETKPGKEVQHLLSVVHITDDGMEFIEPLEITDTHVVIDVPHLSVFGLVWVWERIQNLISVVLGQVLLFLKPPNPRKQRQKLDVLLLPVNVPVEDVQQQWPDALYIDVTPQCDLITNHKYRVECPEACLIQPKENRFDLNFGPNYHKMFEIRLPTNTEEVTLTIRDQENSDVWTHEVDLPGKTFICPPEDRLNHILHTHQTQCHIISQWSTWCRWGCGGNSRIRILFYDVTTRRWKASTHQSRALLS
uniref:FIIND domain-containing protein n=1 Tax=Sphaeramia orbicularis TaxID=375764 RepID=A0A673AMU0_9TELE